MRGLRFLLVIFGLQCAFTLIEAQPKSMLLLPSDFGTQTQLANLTAQHQHQLLLETVLQKEKQIISVALNLELLTKSIGNDFYGFAAEDSANAENIAIVKATFECFTQLLHQDQILKLFPLAAESGVAYAKETGSVSKGFSRMASKIDESLKNDTCYAVAKEKYKNQMQTSPKKTYHYGIPKSDDDLRKIVAEWINDPQMKKLLTHLTYAFFNSFEESITRRSILELAKLPGKLELVQKIYEESIEAVTSQVKDVSPDQIDLKSSIVDINMKMVKPILSKTLLSKINENPNLKNDFEPIYKRVRIQMH